MDIRWWAAGFISGQILFRIMFPELGIGRSLGYLVLSLIILIVIYFGATVFQGSMGRKIDRAYPDENAGGKDV